MKTFYKPFFEENKLVSSFEESYYSTSSKGMIRGLHFQEPPMAHVKLVSCLQGSIIDVTVDLRKNSPTFKKVQGIQLDADKGELLYVPEGLAHGFGTLSNTSLFLSMNSGVFDADCENGLRWDGIGFQWPMSEPIISEKDASFGSLDEYNSPF